MKKQKFLKKPGIYLIRNKINGKCYCGQSVDLQGRIATHKRADSEQVVHKAIRKHGVENFEFNVLLYCDKDMLNHFEIECIKLYNSLKPNGYNMTNGGSMDEEELLKIKHKRESGEIVVKDKKGINLSKESRKKMSISNTGENNVCSKEIEDITGRRWISCNVAAKELDVSPSSLSQMLNSRPSLLPHLHYLDLHFVETRPENYQYKSMEEIEHLKVPKKVMVYKKPKEERIPAKKKRVVDDLGRAWESVSECADFFNIKRSKMCMMLKGERNFVEEANGIGLRYENEEHKNKVFRKPANRKKDRPASRRVIDKNGKIYKSARECARELNIEENRLSSMLRGVCSFRRDLIDLELKYMDEYKPKNWTGKPSSRKGVKNSEEVRNKIKEALSKTLHPKSRAVIDNIGREWKMIKDAAKEFDICDVMLGKMLRGLREMRSDLVLIGLRFKE